VIILILILLAQSTIPSSLEKHAIVPEKAKAGEQFCILNAIGSRERHAWVYREYFYKYQSGGCLPGPTMTRTNKGWVLRLNGKHISISSLSDSQMMVDAVMATEIEP